MDSLGASWATDVAFIEGIPVAWSSNCLRCHDGVVHVLPCRHLIFHSLVVAALFTGRVVRHVVGGYLDGGLVLKIFKLDFKTNMAIEI